MSAMPQFLSPDTWLRHLFSSQAAQEGVGAALQGAEGGAAEDEERGGDDGGARRAELVTLVNAVRGGDQSGEHGVVADPEGAFDGRLHESATLTPGPCQSSALARG